MTTVPQVARLTRGAAGALRLGRGLADRAVRLTGPPLARTAGQVAARLQLRRRTTTPSHPTTFTPSKRAEPEQPADGPPASRPSPGTVAHNIAPQRPTARPAPARPTRKSVPGAKLPPRRSATQS